MRYVRSETALKCVNFMKEWVQLCAIKCSDPFMAHMIETVKAHRP